MAMAGLDSHHLRFGRDVYGLRAGGVADSVGHGAIVLTADPAMQPVADRYVLHVVPSNGGGVDRYVRDICAHRPRDCILHVVDGQVVLEIFATGRFIPIDGPQLEETLHRHALGDPSLLHVHSTLRLVREVTKALCAASRCRYVLTLHDVDFAGASADVGADEREARHAFVRSAAARIVPSKFIEDLLTSTLGSNISRQLIPNGVDCVAMDYPPSAVPIKSRQFQVAVVGALGPHKGLDFLRDVVAALPAEIGVAVIGYADGQLAQGWHISDRLWVHGAFEPGELAELFRGYGSVLTFFPNRQPESYCYALSDVWCAGLPALGPASGAIGERIAKTGAGWTFAADSSATEVAAMIPDCLRAAGQSLETVRLAVDQLLSCQEMVTGLNQQYEEVAQGGETEPDLSALQSLAATHLNGKLFRTELLRLTGDLQFAQSQIAKTEEALRSLAREYQGRGDWIATLQTHFDDAQTEIKRLETARTAEHAEHVRNVEKFSRDVADTLAVAHHYERALAMLPVFFRRWLLRRADRVAGDKDRS